MEMQDLLVEDSWIDKNGEAKTALRKVGVSLPMKGGGWRHKFYKNISISGEALSLPPRKKGKEDAAVAEDDDGSGGLF